MHEPVLKKEVLKYLDPKSNHNYVDCTINGGGHSAAILKAGEPSGRILGIELDKEIYNNLKNKIAEFSISNSQSSNRTVLVNDSYVNLEKIVKENNFGPVHGILFDLGVSSYQLDQSERGFTFRHDQPLDMRYSVDNDLTAEEIVNTWSLEEIVEILEKYGEERRARRIAKEIISHRPIKTTFQLIDIIGGKKGRINPATRTFQALRIAVNRELESLEKALPIAEKLLTPGGRLAVISFHSLEDRIVKNFLKESSLKILTKKPITGSGEEVKENPRARSAKLRVGEKI